MDQPQHPSYAVPHLAGPVLRRAGEEVHWLWFAALLAANLAASLPSALGLTAAITELLDIQGYLLVQTGFSSLVAGAAQWLVLRRYAPISWAWVPATVAASVAANLLGAGLGLQGWPGLLPSVLAVAASQALVLSRRLRGAGRWLLAAALSSILSLLLPFQFYSSLISNGSIGRLWIFAILANVAGALIHAVIEGTALRRLLQDNASGRE